MTEKQIIKKGTKIAFKGACHLAGSDAEFDEFILSEDKTLDELNQEAYEHAVEYFQVEGWTEIIELPEVH